MLVGVWTNHAPGANACDVPVHIVTQGVVTFKLDTGWDKWVVVQEVLRCFFDGFAKGLNGLGIAQMSLNESGMLLKQLVLLYYVLPSFGKQLKTHNVGCKVLLVKND